jgi:hypothetical protein
MPSRPRLRRHSCLALPLLDLSQDLDPKTFSPPNTSTATTCLAVFSAREVTLLKHVFSHVSLYALGQLSPLRIMNFLGHEDALTT